MSAWIEIFTTTCCPSSLIVALYMSAWIEILQIYRSRQNFLSHSTWVRGLKSVRTWVRESDRCVALYMSAWIEIFASPAGSPGYISRTLHECVDWNTVLAKQLKKEPRSHSTWVRGLKYEHVARFLIQVHCRTLHECADWNFVSHVDLSQIR